MATIAKVTYSDGSKAEVRWTGRAQLTAEQQMGPNWNGMPLMFTYRVTWATLNKDGAVSADFDTWADTVEEIVTSEADVPPTQPDHSVDVSSE